MSSKNGTMFWNSPATCRDHHVLADLIGLNLKKTTWGMMRNLWNTLCSSYVCTFLIHVCMLNLIDVTWDAKYVSDIIPACVSWNEAWHSNKDQSSQRCLIGGLNMFIFHYFLGWLTTNTTIFFDSLNAGPLVCKSLRELTRQAPIGWPHQDIFSTEKLFDAFTILKGVWHLDQ